MADDVTICKWCQQPIVKLDEPGQFGGWWKHLAGLGVGTDRCELDMQSMLGEPAGIEVCGRDGHDPTPGLRYDLARLALVADCQRCGAVMMLDQEVQG